MPAGIQVKNDQGTFQIDGTYRGFVLARKLTVTTNEQMTFGNPIVSRGSFQLNAGEIVALRSANACCVERVFGSQMYLLSKGDVGTVIEVFVFEPITGPGGNYGFQVYSDVNPGQIVFCALKKPLCFVGFPQGDGDFYYQGGRKYAAIVMTQNLKIVDEALGPPQGGFYDRFFAVVRGMVTGLDGGVRVKTEPLYSSVTRTSTSSGTAPSRAIQSNANNYHAIIDVTNY